MANRVLRRPMFRMGGSPNFEFQERQVVYYPGLTDQRSTHQEQV